MAYNNFRLSVILRIVLLSLNVILLVFLIYKTQYIMTTVIAVATLLYQIYSLVVYVENTQKDLIRFLQAIKYEDFFETFSGSGGRIAKLLHSEFNRIIRDFRKVRVQKEEQYLYLQTVVQHVGVALLTYDSDGVVELFNSTFRHLFKIPHIRNIKRLGLINADLVKCLEGIKAGEKHQVKVMFEGELMLLSIHATEFSRHGKRYKLVSIQDIRAELEEKELEAWQNLIRVLTHEIRNSITPITSLAASTDYLLANVKEEKHEFDEELEDARLAISTICKRSKGLLRFVEAFRSLYKVPDPNFSRVSVSEMFIDLQTFFDVKFNEKNIETKFLCHPAALEIIADRDLIEQVMINLLTNSIQAINGKEEGHIYVKGLIDRRGRPSIIINDNGSGISEETMEKIFVPFFTTKSNGTGVGLSLSRQIMRLHKGTITVESTPDKSTSFVLSF